MHMANLFYYYMITIVVNDKAIYVYTHSYVHSYIHCFTYTKVKTVNI